MFLTCRPNLVVGNLCSEEVEDGGMGDDGGRGWGVDDGGTELYAC